MFGTVILPLDGIWPCNVGAIFRQEDKGMDSHSQIKTSPSRKALNNILFEM